MTRIRVLKRAEMNAEQGQVYDEAEAARGPLGGPYWAYIRLPPFMRIAQEMSRYLRTGPLPLRERQIAVLTVARHWGAKFPWAAQVRVSLAAGLEPEVIDAINAKKKLTLANRREQLAHDVAHELLADHGLSEATYGAAATQFSEEELVALVATIGQFSMTCLTANAFDITPPEGANMLR